MEIKLPRTRWTASRAFQWKTKSALCTVPILVLLTLASVWTAGAATTTLAAATGGSAISADNFASGTWTSLTGPIMTESGGGAISSTLGTIVLTVPADYEFKTGVPVTVLVTGSATATANINGTANNTTIAATVTASNVMITVTARSSVANILTWQNLQVRPRVGTPLGSTNITLGGTAVSKGLSTGANCGTLTRVAGAATQLAFGVQPGNAAATTVFIPAVTVQIRDQSGNLTTNTSAVTIGIGTNPGGGALSGSTSVNAVSGTASFSTLSIDKIGTGYTLTANCAGLPGTNSSAFNITNGAPVKLVITTAPQSLIAGVVSSLITVAIQDAGGNPVNTPTNRSITLATSSAGGLFRDVADTTNITTLTLPAGASSTKYRYKDTLVGMPTLTNAASGLASATQTEAVNAAAAALVRVETLANGTGTVVAAQNLSAGNSLTVFAIARDAFSNFVANAAADLWSLRSKTGGVADGDLVPSGDRKSAVFTGHLPGTAAVRATAGALTPTESGTLTVYLPDPDLPGTRVNFETIPAGSLVIPMDNNLQALSGTPFNLKAYGLINALLHTNIPVKWAIAVGKAKDASDFTAEVQRLLPTSQSASNLSFFSGPFIVHRDFTNRAMQIMTNFGNSVAVYRLTTNAIVDIRYTVAHKPQVAVLDDGNTDAIHTDILAEAGFPTSHYLVLHAADVEFLPVASCFTIVTSPHFDGGTTATNQTHSIRDFILDGGNFLAQCAAVRTYEDNTVFGHFHSTLGFADDNSASSFTYPNADMAFNQFQGALFDEGGSLQDWVLNPGSVLTNSAYALVLKLGDTNVFRAGVSKLTRGRPGSVVFYLGGHSYSGSSLEDYNGRRMYLNAILVPPDRPAGCVITFQTDLGITKTDGVVTVTNGQTVTYTLVVTNQGPGRVVGATVTDLLPASLTNVTWISAVTAGAMNFNPSGAGNINATVDIPIFGSVVFTVQAWIGSEASCLVTNTASVALPASMSDSNPNNNVAVDVDHILPPFSCPPDRTVSCVGDVPAAATNTAGFIAQGGSVTGNCCGSPTTVSHLGDLSNGGSGCPANPLIITRTYRITAGCGDTSDCAQTLTVSDATPPMIICPANVVVGPDPGQLSRSNVTYIAAASDNCTGAVTVAYSPPSGSTFPLGITTVSCNATDACGNTASCSFTVTVVNAGLTAINCSTNRTVGTGAPWTFDEPTATTQCGTNVTLSVLGTVTNIIGGCSATFTATRTWRATDDCGNSAQCSQTITVVDTTPSQITCPASITVNAADGLCASNVTFVVGATDNCSVTNLVRNPPSGSAFPVGVTMVTSTATDASGNQSTCLFTVTVLDNQNPVILCPSNLVLTADLTGCSRSNVTFFVGATDNCRVTNLVSSMASGSTFPLGTTTVTNTATDASGKTTSCSFTVTVTDNQPPVIICPGNLVLTADAGRCSRSNVTFNVSATDNCGVANLVSSPPNGSTFPIGVTMVTSTATDASGNQSSCNFTVTVADNQNSVITCSSNLVLTADAGRCSRSNVTFFVGATDNCRVTNLVSSMASGSTFPIGTTTVTNTATDASGNTTSCSFTVTVTDNQPPVIICPGNLVLAADTGRCSRSNVTFNVSATDNCGVANLVSSPPNGSAFPVGVTTVTNTATDAGGNQSRCTFTVTVLDQQPPVIICPPDITTNTAPGANVVTNIALGTPVTADNCAVAGVSNNAPAILPVGTNFVLWTVTDVGGNTNSCQQRVVVVYTCSGILRTTTLAGQSICPNQPVLLGTTASSPEPISYLWKFNGQPMPGQTNSSLMLPHVDASGGGVYSLEARTECAAVTLSATVTVLAAPDASPASYTNSEGIIIDQAGETIPYYSVLTPQCVPGPVKNLTVNIFGFFHAFPSDVSVVLVSPDGRQVKLMAGAGGGESLTAGVNLTFSDAATNTLPESDRIVSGTYLPTDYLPGLFQPPPAAGPYSNRLAAFIGADPNGPWKLCVFDGVALDGGGIASWSLDITWRGEILYLQNPGALPNGEFRVEVVGQTGIPTIIERSADLVTWRPVATNVFSSNPGVFLDPAPLYPYRFYRALQP